MADTAAWERGVVTAVDIEGGIVLVEFADGTGAEAEFADVRPDHESGNRLEITAAAVHRVASSTGWSIQNHVSRVYDTFRFRNGKPPAIGVRPDEHRPAIQQSLMDWNADLGARHKMDWPGFLAEHQRLITPLAELPTLGGLTDDQIDLVCEVVGALENFKSTKGRTLVFGSKAAHFYFPGLVPVMSSEVQSGLLQIQRLFEAELGKRLGGRRSWFAFRSVAPRRDSYRNYVVLGNALLRDADMSDLPAWSSDAGIHLHAKIFEWWVIGCGLG